MEPNTEIPAAAPNDGAPVHPEPEPVADAKPERKKKETPEHLRPEVLAKYDAATIKMVNTLVSEIDTLDAEHLAKKSEAKEAKEAWEAKRDELQRVLKERKANRGKPVQKTLLDEIAPPPEQPAPPLEVATPAEPSARDLLWRDYPLERLGVFGMTERDIEILASGERKGGLGTRPCTTVGKLADYSAGGDGIPNHISDFKGLGASGATRIDAALEGFWGWWSGGGLAEFAREKGLPDADDATQPGAGGGTPAQGGDGDVQGEHQGAGGGDGSGGSDTVVFVEHLPNATPDPDLLTDEELAAIPTGNDATYSLGGDGEAE